MDAAVPAVEVADDGDALRVWRPDGEVHAARCRQLGGCAPSQSYTCSRVPFAEQMQIVVGGDTAEAVQVVELDASRPFELDEATGSRCRVRACET